MNPDKDMDVNDPINQSFKVYIKYSRITYHHDRVPICIYICGDQLQI